MRQHAGIDSAGKSCPCSERERESEFEIAAARAAGPRDQRALAIIINEGQPPIHRDPVANICLRIQRGQRKRAIRINGRKVVPTKGANTGIEIVGGPTWRASRYYY